MGGHRTSQLHSIRPQRPPSWFSHHISGKTAQKLLPEMPHNQETSWEFSGIHCRVGFHVTYLPYKQHPFGWEGIIFSSFVPLQPSTVFQSGTVPGVKQSHLDKVNRYFSLQTIPHPPLTKFLQCLDRTGIQPSTAKPNC